MLPDRSKRYAGIDGEIPRLGLVSNWQLFLLGLLVVALLVLIFPRKALVEQLYAQETLDDLTLSYVQNLYRADTRNPDVAILLARIQQDVLAIEGLESILLPLTTQGDERQRTQARSILLNAYQKALAKPAYAGQASVRLRLIALLEASKNDVVPDALARSMASAAFAAKKPALALAFLAQVQHGSTAQDLEQYARETLALGEYTVAAQYFFRARAQAANVTEARRLFKAGVDTLMAKSLFSQAMQEAAAHLGNLSDDRATLRYLVRVARAAGQPETAARYARALVFLPADRAAP